MCHVGCAGGGGGVLLIHGVHLDPPPLPNTNYYFERSCQEPVVSRIDLNNMSQRSHEETWGINNKNKMNGVLGHLCAHRG